MIAHDLSSQKLAAYLAGLRSVGLEHNNIRRLWADSLIEVRGRKWLLMFLVRQQLKGEVTKKFKCAACLISTRPVSSRCRAPQTER
jgi:hypothetical protein